MNITLKMRVEGKKERQDKKFIAKFIPARLFKDSMAMVREFESMTEEEMLNNSEFCDKMVKYIVDTFDEQFTVDELYNSLDISDILSKYQECIKSVMEKFAGKTAELAKIVPNK